MRKLLIILVLVLSGLLRLVSINQSLWLDEAISVQVAKNYSLLDIPSKFSISDFHPPLYYMFLNVWTKVFGYSEISVRLPSVIFSLITVFFIYLIVLKINKKTAIWAAVFVGLNPLFVYYSQEARMYSMVTMWLIIALYFYNKLWADIKTKDLILYNLFLFLSFITFYGSIFFICALSLYWLVNKRKIGSLILMNIGIILAIITISPLLINQINGSKTMLVEVKNWKSVLGTVDVKNLLLFPIKFTSGRISFYPKIAYYLISGIWAMMVFLPIFLNFKKNKKYLLICVVTLVIAIIFSIFSPLMQYFRFLYLVPILGAMLALSVKNNFKYIYGGIFLLFSLSYLLNINTHREDWKNMVGEIKTEKVYMIASAADPVNYYNNKIEIVDIRNANPSENSITVIPYVEEVHGINHNIILNNLGYKLGTEKNYRQLKIETWNKVKTKI